MLERKKASLIRTTTSNVPAVLAETQRPVPLGQPRWTPIPEVVPNQFWEHAVSQYATSHVLENGHQDYEAHDVPFGHGVIDPTLTGDEVGLDGFPRPTGPPSFQYASSSLNSALENPLRSDPPSTPTYYSPPFSPESTSVDVGTVLSMSDVPTCEGGGQVPAPARGDIDADPTADVYIDGTTSDQSQDVSSRDVSRPDFPDDTGRPPSRVAAVSLAPPPQLFAGSPASQTEDEEMHNSSPIGAPACGSDQISRYYRTEAQKAQTTASQRRRSGRQGPPPRLSCNLPATSDPSYLAYACGHSDCWPAGEAQGSHRYATSKELSDHYKIKHADDMSCPNPFRCALAGCDRSWKSINGLQYHLQVSKVHFQQALERSYSLQSDSFNGPGAPEASGAKSSKKVHPCPHHGCRKQYKQISGLRYHLAHGHPQDRPAQLDVIPPGLARKLAEKVQDVQLAGAVGSEGDARLCQLPRLVLRSPASTVATDVS